jgi:hypothetical protein
MVRQVMGWASPWHVLVSFAHEVHNEEPDCGKEHKHFDAAQENGVQSELVIHLEVQDRLLPLQEAKVVVFSIINIFLYLIKQPVSELVPHSGSQWLATAKTTRSPGPKGWSLDMRVGSE